LNKKQQFFKNLAITSVAINILIFFYSSS